MTNKDIDSVGNWADSSAAEVKARGLKLNRALTKAILTGQRTGDESKRIAAARDEAELRRLLDIHNRALKERKDVRGEEREAAAPAPIALKCSDCGALTKRAGLNGLAVHLRPDNNSICVRGPKTKKNKGRAVSSRFYRDRAVSGGLPGSGRR